MVGPLEWPEDRAPGKISVTHPVLPSVPRQRGAPAQPCWNAENNEGGSTRVALSCLVSLTTMATSPVAATTAGAPVEMPRLNEKVEKLIDELVHNLRRRCVPWFSLCESLRVSFRHSKIVGSAELTVQTGKLFLALIATLKPTTLAAVRLCMLVALAVVTDDYNYCRIWSKL